MIKEKDLQIDRNLHAVYSKPCKKIILEYLKKHYQEEEVEQVFEQIQHQYEKYLHDFNRKDLGGEKNFHNKKSGTYDCIMLVCCYVICKPIITFKEIEEMEKTLVVANFKNLKFVNIDKTIFKKLMYKAFQNAEKKCNKWHDYEMHLNPYSDDKPMHYCFTKCPFADFIRQFGLEEIGGALCNVDYPSMEALNVKLFRQHTCIESDYCDYTFYSCNDPFMKEHPEYVDEKGFIRNK